MRNYELNLDNYRLGNFTMILPDTENSLSIILDKMTIPANLYTNNDYSPRTIEIEICDLDTQIFGYKLYCKRKRYSRLEWISNESSNYRTDLLFRLIDRLNNYFDVGICYLSDESVLYVYDVAISKYPVHLPLWLLEIFKYGQTYYERRGWAFNFESYKSSGLKEIDSIDDYNYTKEYLRTLKLDSIPTKFILYGEYDSSKPIGEYFVRLARCNYSELFIDLYADMTKNIIGFRIAIDKIKSAMSFYSKSYNISLSANV
jgi:hypothetical protein